MGKAMSSYGELVFYQVEHSFDPVRQLIPLLTACGIDSCVDAYRTTEEDRTWDAYLRGEPECSAPEEHLGRDIELHEVPALYVPGLRLRLSLAAGPLLESVQASIATRIGEDIRGLFIPSELFVLVGEYDLIASDEIPEGSLIARAFLSICFWGYGVARDWEEMRSQVFRLPEVQAAKRRIETVVGPLQQDIYWNL
jgi:hypothetical protein